MFFNFLCMFSSHFLGVLFKFWKVIELPHLIRWKLAIWVFQTKGKFWQEKVMSRSRLELLNKLESVCSSLKFEQTTFEFYDLLQINTWDHFHTIWNTCSNSCTLLSAKVDVVKFTPLGKRYSARENWLSIQNENTFTRLQNFLSKKALFHLKYASALYQSLAFTLTILTTLEKFSKEKTHVDLMNAFSYL